MSAESAETTARETARSKPIRLLGRVGLLAYGLVHILLAFLAIRIAIGGLRLCQTEQGRRLAGSRGTTWRREIMLWLITVGLAALTIWQLAEALWGYAALGVAYGAVGVLVVVAAATNDPAKPIGMDAALHTLASQPYGKVLLAIVAVGLACFGLYCVLDARYRED